LRRWLGRLLDRWLLRRCLGRRLRQVLGRLRLLRRCLGRSLGLPVSARRRNCAGRAYRPFIAGRRTHRVGDDYDDYASNATEKGQEKRKSEKGPEALALIAGHLAGPEAEKDA